MARRTSRQTERLAGPALLAGLLLFWACSSIDLEAPAPFRTAPASERYLGSLQDAGLLATPMGRAWKRAAEDVLVAPTPVETPYREALFFAPERPMAVAYRISLGIGQELRVSLEGEAVRGRAFLDLFGPVPAASQKASGASSPPFVEEAVAGPDTAGGALLEHVVERDGEYLLRLQPELLTGGRLTLAIEAGGRLDFPVEGKDARAIGSGWGAPRDGGRRSHRGVDIFADRGTPALAAVDGRVTRVGTNRLGGNVVWLQGEGLSFYYAHLDRQLVRAGTRVAAGDPVGTVGNTGNAARTPPHLHFEVRRGGGAEDPAPYLARRASAPPVTAPLENLGRQVRVAAARVNFRALATTRSEVLASLDRYTALQVSGATGDWYRATLPDGRKGFLSARLAESTERPLATQRFAADRPLLHKPFDTSFAVGVVRAGDEARVLSRFADYAFLASANAEGWVRF